MEHILSMNKRYGVDVGYHDSSLDTLNNEGRVGKLGIDKTYSLDKVIKLAYDIKANIIIKAGKNAKWYLKKINLENIEKDIEKQKWRDTSRVTMWIIEWE
tara:strand:+ start:115 stop:414 length:300 start_codon:yes stop_codon:yes gene_type:complete